MPLWIILIRLCPLMEQVTNAPEDNISVLSSFWGSEEAQF
jgi:hypothetical protein